MILLRGELQTGEEESVTVTDLGEVKVKKKKVGGRNQVSKECLWDIFVRRCEAPLQRDSSHLSFLSGDLKHGHRPLHIPSLICSLNMGKL